VRVGGSFLNGFVRLCWPFLPPCLSPHPLTPLAEFSASLFALAQAQPFSSSLTASIALDVSDEGSAASVDSSSGRVDIRPLIRPSPPLCKNSLKSQPSHGAVDPGAAVPLLPAAEVLRGLALLAFEFECGNSFFISAGEGEGHCCAGAGRSRRMALVEAAHALSAQQLEAVARRCKTFSHVTAPPPLCLPCRVGIDPTRGGVWVVSRGAVGQRVRRDGCQTFGFMSEPVLWQLVVGGLQALEALHEGGVHGAVDLSNGASMPLSVSRKVFVCVEPVRITIRASPLGNWSAHTHRDDAQANDLRVLGEVLFVLSTSGMSSFNRTSYLHHDVRRALELRGYSDQLCFVVSTLAYSQKEASQASQMLSLAQAMQKLAWRWGE
jgi:hypothetical protein